MEKEIIEKANKIISLIERNKKAVENLEPFSQIGLRLFFSENKYGYASAMCPFHDDVEFEDWEVRLIIHQKKQRIQALEKQLEQL